MKNLKNQKEILRIERNFLTEEEAKQISDYIIETEDFVKSLGPDTYPGTSEDSLTGRNRLFNYLYMEPMRSILVPKFKELFGKCTVNCWANIFRRGEGIAPHQHQPEHLTDNVSQTFAANIFLSGPPISTSFDIDVPENHFPGTFTYFNSNVKHWVEPNNTDELRVTIAFNIFQKNVLPYLGMKYKNDVGHYRI